MKPEDEKMVRGIIMASALFCLGYINEVGNDGFLKTTDTRHYFNAGATFPI